MLHTKYPGSMASGSRQEDCYMFSLHMPMNNYMYYPLQGTKLVVWFIFAMPRVCLQSVIVVFPDHTHYFARGSLDDATCQISRL